MMNGKMIGRMFRRALGVLGIMGLAALPAQGQTHIWNIGLDGAQETPPVVTPATGTAVVTYDTGTRLLEWEVHYSGLVANATNAHFHGPAALGEGPAGVRLGMVSSTPATITQADIGGTSGSYIGYHTISEENEAELLAGLWYINIHSTQHPGGEIRGQVIPEPTAMAVLALTGGTVLLRRRRTGANH
jgi:hypothetical protein